MFARVVMTNTIATYSDALNYEVTHFHLINVRLVNCLQWLWRNYTAKQPSSFSLSLPHSFATVHSDTIGIIQSLGIGVINGINGMVEVSTKQEEKSGAQAASCSVMCRSYSYFTRSFVTPPFFDILLTDFLHALTLPLQTLTTINDIELMSVCLIVQKDCKRWCGDPCGLGWCEPRVLVTHSTSSSYSSFEWVCH
jgi:hypothetical protein